MSFCQLRTMKKAVMDSHAAIYSAYLRSSTSLSLVIEGQTTKTKLLLFSDLPTVANALAVKLLAEPLTMDKTLTKGTGSLRVPWFIPICKGMKVLPSP